MHIFAGSKSTFSLVANTEFTDFDTEKKNIPGPRVWMFIFLTM